VEPHATPAATRGPQPCPHPDHAITKTDSKNDMKHRGSEGYSGHPVEVQTNYR